MSHGFLLTAKTRNQIDYILVQKENLNLIKNCREYKSADIGSDYSLLMSKFNLPITGRNQIRKQVTRYDVDKLKDDNYTYIFKQNIGGRLETLLHMDPNTDVEELYNSFKNMTNYVTKETVGLRKRKSIEGLSMKEAELCLQRQKTQSSMLNNPSTQNCETY